MLWEETLNAVSHTQKGDVEIGGGLLGRKAPEGAERGDEEGDGLKKKKKPKMHYIQVGKG